MPFQDGLAYPFVLDAVLAVAALHKAYVEPEHSKKYMSACLYYQNQCLYAYQKELANINEDNCHAIFAVSALVHILNIAISPGGPTLSPTPPIETLLLQFQLTRGIMVVLSTAWHTVSTAHYKGLFKIPGYNTPTNAVNTPEVAYAMEELQRCVANTESTDTTVQNVYKTSVESLGNHFKHVEQGGDLNAIVAWPIHLDDKAEQLLADRDPLMMLICVHYGVLCLHVHDKWWAHNFGCRLIWELSDSLHALEASWLPLTSWARSKAASIRAASADLKLR